MLGLVMFLWTYAVFKPHHVKYKRICDSADVNLKIKS
jgi:hypothetical protein